MTPDSGPSVYTTLTLADGPGLTVNGSIDSITSCLADGRRHNEPVALLTPAGLVHVDPWHRWELEEVRHVG